MRIPHVVMFCCFSAVVSAEASAVLEVSGHVGGEVSIHCSGSWTTSNGSEHHSVYFCKGDCSRGNILIQTERKRLAVTRQGRYSMMINRDDGAFNVTIRRLRRADAGTYHCGVEGTSNLLQLEVNLMVVNASTVPPGSPPSTTTATLQSGAETPPQGSSAFSTEPSPAAAASTLPATENKTNQPAAAGLKDTTVVIIVSVSLALLVCAIIPLIFYGHCRTNAEGQNKGESDYCDENASVASTQAAVRLQSLERDADPEASTHNDTQYAAAYQALDPQALSTED